MSLPGRRARVAAAAAVCLLLATGHVVYWYAPRERPAEPDPEDLPGRLLAAGGYDAAVWVPYPHQNLWVLRRALGGEGGAAEWLAAAGRLAGLPPPSLPSFGPFPLPPAREMVVAFDRRDGRGMVAARVYPILARVARLAGWVAGNPWLAGGEVPAFGGTARVAWEGGLWTVTTDGSAALPGAEARPPSGAALTILHLRRPADWLPADLYRLRRPAGRPRDLELVSAGVEAAGAALPRWRDRRFPASGVAFAVANGRGGPAAEEAGVLVVFARGGGGELPETAALAGRGVEEDRRLRLPQERLSRLLGGSVERVEEGGWQLLGSDRQALAILRRLAPDLAALLETAGGEAGEGLLGGLWLDPRATGTLVADTAATLEAIPLVSRREVQRWRDGERVLAPLREVDRVTLVMTSGPRSFRLRLHRRVARD